MGSMNLAVDMSERFPGRVTKETTIPWADKEPIHGPHFELASINIEQIEQFDEQSDLNLAHLNKFTI
jgi:hypothetical protein